VDELALQAAISEAAWRRVGEDIWLERLRRRMRRPEHAGVEERLVKGIHESLYLRQSGYDDQTTVQANRRLRDAYREAGEAVGLEPPPWH
jgi:hypothetical protein